MHSLRFATVLTLLIVFGCGGNKDDEPVKRDFQCELCVDFETAAEDCERLFEESDCEIGVSVFPDLPRLCGGDQSVYCIFHECGAAPACAVPERTNEGGGAGAN